MKLADTKLKKTLIFVLGSILMILLAILLFISPIAKHLIEKYDEEYTGRQITLGWVYLNPFTGYVHLHNIKIFESESPSALTHSDSVFFSAKGLSANFNLLKLASKTIEISKLTLNKPKGIIIQNKSDLNFNDLIAKFTPDKKDITPSAFHFNLLKVKIKNGEFHYCEKLIPINYFIKNVNIESQGLYWNVDTVALKFSFAPGTGTGNAAGDININLKNLDYNLAIVVKEFDLDIIQQYLNDLANYGVFSATLNADIQSIGNFKIVEKVTNKGILTINDFHFGKTSNEDVVSFEKFVLAIHEVSPGKRVYQYDSVLIIKPYFNYERYDELDNLQTMFGEKGANILAIKADPTKFNLILEIADYVKELAKNFYTSNYKVDKLMIVNGNINFNDFSLTEKFSIQLNPLTIYADSINKLANSINFSIKSGIKPYGDMMVDLNINPQDSSDFNLLFKLHGIPIAMFNPYIINYTSYPVDRGTLELNGNWDVKRGKIKSDNHLLVIDPRINKKLKTNEKKHIPLPLIMYLIRDRGNVIDYSIPISGNLNDPNFHVRDVVFDVLGNVFIKPPSTPYREEIKTIENEIEKSLSLKWLPRQQNLHENHIEFLDKIADFIQNNPDETIDVYPNPYTIKEKEYILFFEAKKKYFLHTRKDTNALSENDSLEIEKMSIKDEAIVSYLKSEIKDTMLFTVQDLCMKLLGADVVDAKFKQLCIEREVAFVQHFNSRGVANRVIFKNEISDIPYNGFSRYKIDYKGEFPAELIEAYERLDEYNGKMPRKRFFKKRKENETLVL